MKQAAFKNPLAYVAGVFITVCASLANSCENGIAKIAGNDRYPPLTWYKNQELTGVSVDVISSILANAGIKVRVAKPTPWKRLVHQASKGDIDILLGVRESQEWSSFLHYVKPAITPSAQGLFFRADTPLNNKASDWEQLHDYIGGTLRGASFGETFDDYAQKNLKIQAANSLQINFLKLLNHRIDYLLAPLMPTQLYIEKAGYSKTIAFSPTPLLVIDEYIAISKSSACTKYAELISKNISKMIEGNTIDELLEQHFLIWFESQQTKI